MKPATTPRATRPVTRRPGSANYGGVRSAGIGRVERILTMQFFLSMADAVLLPRIIHKQLILRDKIRSDPTDRTLARHLHIHLVGAAGTTARNET
jgi:hypothetical protein